MITGHAFRPIVWCASRLLGSSLWSSRTVPSRHSLHSEMGLLLKNSLAHGLSRATGRVAPPLRADCQSHLLGLPQCTTSLLYDCGVCFASEFHSQSSDLCVWRSERSSERRIALFPDVTSAFSK